MANKKDKREEEIKVTKDGVKLDKVFQDLYKKISTNTYDTDRELNTDQIKNLVNRIDDVINSDLEELKEFIINPPEPKVDDTPDVEVVKLTVDTFQKSRRIFCMA